MTFVYNWLPSFLYLKNDKPEKVKFSIMFPFKPNEYNNKMFWEILYPLNNGVHLKMAALIFILLYLCNIIVFYNFKFFKDSSFQSMKILVFFLFAYNVFFPDYSS